MLRPKKEKRKKQIGERVHFSDGRFGIMVTPKEFSTFKRPKLTCLVHEGKNAIVFEERRKQPSSKSNLTLKDLSKRQLQKFIKGLRQGGLTEKRIKKILEVNGIPYQGFKDRRK